ncbi:cytochrome P450 [Aspergillus spectabilis]
MPRMDQPISDAMERSRATLIELLIAYSHKTTSKAPTLQYLNEETFTFIDAGVDTSGRTVAAAIYYIIQNPGVEQKLRAELDDCPVTESKGERVYVKLLSTLPYLNAVIKETHRT